MELLDGTEDTLSPSQDIEPVEYEFYHEDWVIQLERTGLKPYLDGAPASVGEYVYSMQHQLVWVMTKAGWRTVTIYAIQSAGDRLPELIRDTMNPVYPR